MTDLKIPPSGYRPLKGDTWPTHAGKRRQKKPNRRRVRAAVELKRKAEHDAHLCQQ